MRADISLEHNAARVNGTFTFLNAGPGHAAIQLFGTPEVAPGDEPGAAPLVTVLLARPVGEIVAGVLVLKQEDLTGDLIASTGTAVWARFLNGDGAWAMDTDVSLEGGDGAVQLPTLLLYAGGRCPLSPSTIG